MTADEIKDQIIQKQDELINKLNEGFGTEMVQPWEYEEVINSKNELASLRQQLEKAQEAEADKAGINELIPDTSENANQYNGRPNPQDVNPYDGRAILRKRNK